MKKLRSTDVCFDNTCRFVFKISLKENINEKCEICHNKSYQK